MLDEQINVQPQRLKSRMQNITTPIQVLMLCPDVKVKGGISSVINLILQEASPQANIQSLFTDVEGSPLLRLKVFSQTVVGLLWKLLSEDIDVVYIHMSQRGSVIRKSILVLIAALFHKPIVMHTTGVNSASSMAIYL